MGATRAEFSFGADQVAGVERVPDKRSRAGARLKDADDAQQARDRSKFKLRPASGLRPSARGKRNALEPLASAGESLEEKVARERAHNELVAKRVAYLSIDKHKHGRRSLLSRSCELSCARVASKISLADCLSPVSVSARRTVAEFTRCELCAQKCAHLVNERAHLLLVRRRQVSTPANKCSEFWSTLLREFQSRNSSPDTMRRGRKRAP